MTRPPRASAATLHDVLNALDRLDASVTRLTETLHAHLSEHPGAQPPHILRGWAEICRYFQMGRRALGDYKRTMAFPAVRVGAHVYSSPAMIDQWLLLVDAKKRQHKLRDLQAGRGNAVT